MATAPGLRSKGIGRNLLAFAEKDLTNLCPVRQLWCNARVPAARFYQSLGWKISSEMFEIPTAGPHYRMAKRLL
jgi:GNAT superfamily N-acetyltransferase